MRRRSCASHCPTLVVRYESPYEAKPFSSEIATVASFDGLTVDAAREHDARWIVRGLRAISDFEVEGQLAHNNRVLAPDIDTVFFMTSVEFG